MPHITGILDTSIKNNVPHMIDSPKVIDDSPIKVICPECRHSKRHLPSCSKAHRCINCKQPGNIHLTGCLNSSN